MVRLVRLQTEIELGDMRLRPGTIRRVVGTEGDLVLIPHPGQPDETIALEFGEYEELSKEEANG
jgi:hypothetical protein